MRAILAACLALATPALSEDGCLALPEGAAPYAVDALTLDDGGLLTVTLPGAPFLAFDFLCPFGDGDSVTCAVDCDGGQVTLTREGDGVRALFRHLRFEQLRVESLIVGQGVNEADGLSLNGGFSLRPAPAAACAPEAHALPYVLQAGDFMPVVGRIEAYLAEGGYLAEPPDWHHTAETARAVAAFQSEIGVPPTGRADPALVRRLGVFTSFAYGGC